MSRRLRHGSALLLLLAVGLVLAAAFGIARPAAAAMPPCHAAGPMPVDAPRSAPAPCGAVVPLLCCGDHTLAGPLVAPPTAGAADLAFLPASPPSPPLPISDTLGGRTGSTARAAPLSTALRVLRL